MFKRMKKMLKKEKGFTLVELLAVIAILGIIVAIAVPSIGNVIGNSETKAHDANIELVENAAKLAAISQDQSSGSYTLQDLVDNGYLEGIPESVGDYSYNSNDRVEVENSNAQYVKFRDSED